MDPSDSQLSACNGHNTPTTRNAGQCNAVQSLDRGGFGFVFGLKSGMSRPRGELTVHCTVPSSSSLPHASHCTTTRRPLRSRLPGMMVQDHVAFRFRCVLNSLPCPFPLPGPLPAYRRARACFLAGRMNGWLGTSAQLSPPPAPPSCLPRRPSSNRQVDTLIPVLSVGPWPQSLFES